MSSAGILPTQLRLRGKVTDNFYGKLVGTSQLYGIASCTAEFSSPGQLGILALAELPAAAPDKARQTGKRDEVGSPNASANLVATSARALGRSLASISEVGFVATLGIGLCEVFIIKRVRTHGRSKRNVQAVEPRRMAPATRQLQGLSFRNLRLLDEGGRRS